MNLQKALNLSWARLRAVAGVTFVLCGPVAWQNSASAEDSAASASAVPACASSLRLRAVQYDPSRAERSFAVFAGAAQRFQPLRRGARVAGYAIERIEQGAVVLASASQRCSVRLRGATVERELRAIAVDEVRAALRARSRPIVSAVSEPRIPQKVGS